MIRNSFHGTRVALGPVLFAALVVLGSVGLVRAESIEDMMLRRIAWITEHYHALAYDGEPLPEIQSVPLENLLGMTGLPPESDIYAVYDHEVNAIFLRDDLDAASLDTGYVIVHELVHYLQNLREPLAEVHCLRSREPEAYRVQEHWQREFGPWPTEWNWLFVMFISDCREARN